MSKIVIAGITNSGKTCYFYGMLRKMMRGYQGFSIRVQDKDYAKLRFAMKRLGDTTVPLLERFPDPSDKLEKYSLDLLYNLKKLDTIEWADYPGEYAAEGREEFINLLEGTNSLLLCIDGSVIKGTMEDAEDIAEEFFNNYGGMDLCNALQQAEKKNEGGFPPVCVIITKYDEVSEELRNMDAITRIVKESFPLLFHEGANGKLRLVTICPVTLGKELMSGGKLNPKSVEKPICFSTYLIQLSILQNLQEKAAGLVKKNQEEVERYKKKGFLKKIFTPKPQPMSEEQIEAMSDLLDQGKSDLDALRSVIESMPLFFNGEASAWPD